jgi:hypothetical protein
MCPVYEDPPPPPWILGGVFICKSGGTKLVPNMKVWVCVSAIIVEPSTHPNKVREFTQGVLDVNENAVLHWMFSGNADIAGVPVYVRS